MPYHGARTCKDLLLYPNHLGALRYNMQQVNYRPRIISSWEIASSLSFSFSFPSPSLYLPLFLLLSYDSFCHFPFIYIIYLQILLKLLFLLPQKTNRHHSPSPAPLFFLPHISQWNTHLLLFLVCF